MAKSKGWKVFKRIFSTFIMLCIIGGTCYAIAYFVGQQKLKDPIIDEKLMLPYHALLEKQYFNQAYTEFTTQGYRDAISYDDYEKTLKILWNQPIKVVFDSKKPLDSRTTRLRYKFLKAANDEIIFTGVYDVFKTDDDKYLIDMTYQPGYTEDKLTQRAF